ncbi:MAG: DUF6359 domain-containing protein [Prevotellaceae bacterium]|jgi:hypothetical protein|nr:DUF6359 domain-containing protein [Prevotellaceae bacterium]
MKRVKLFSIVAIMAILAACTKQQDPTVVKFKSEASCSVKVNGNLDFLVKVRVTNSKGNTTITQEGTLPEGITFTDNGDETAKLSGTPTLLGTFALTFKATNNGITTTQAFTLTVNENGANPGGDGTESSPYSVASAKTNQSGSKWVTGYIVGYAWSGSNTEYYFSADTCTMTTNILIADVATETSGTNCLIVQLPAGALRTGLNLKDNAVILSKKVVLYGELTAYFGQPGLKNTSYYELEDGTTGGTKPGGASGDAVLNESLTNQTSFGRFTAISVTGDEVWTLSTTYGAMISGFTNNASHENEDWFISPAMDLTGKAGTLQFEHARGPAGSITVGVTQGWYSVWVSNDYTSGTPSTATWTELTGITHGTVAWGFVTSGTVSIPEANRAANCRIAFKYLCSNSESATWEVKNVVVQ